MPKQTIMSFLSEIVQLFASFSLDIWQYLMFNQKSEAMINLIFVID